MRPQTHRRERRFNWVGRAEVDPVLRGVVVELEQRLSILGQAITRTGMLGLERLDEQVERPVRFGTRLGHPDLVQHRLGLALHPLGHLVQHIGRLVHPERVPGNWARV